MISTKRYPSEYIKISGEFECTDYIENLQNPLTNIAEPYCMGFMTYQEYPKFFDVNKIVGSSDQSPVLKFEPVVENHSWGFCYYAARSGATSLNSVLYYRNQSDVISKLTSNANESVSFINKMIPAKQTMPNRMGFQIRYMIIRNDCYSFDGKGTNIDPANGSVSNLYMGLGGNVWATLENIESMINGDIPIYTTNTTVNGTHIAMQIFYNAPEYDHEHNIFIKQFDSNYSVVAIIRAAALGMYGKYDGFTDDYGYSPVGLFTTSSIPDLSDVGGTIPQQENAIVCPFNTTGNYIVPRFRLTPPYNYFDTLQTNSLFDNGVAVGCYPYEFDASQALAPVCHDPGGGADYGFYYDRSGLYQNSIFVEFNTDYNPNVVGFRFFTQIDLKDVYRAACLINKIEIAATTSANVTPSSGYGSGTSVALFDSGNYPLNERKTDTYTNIVPYLQEWQKINKQIIENIYDPADMPPYDPTPGDGADSGGDNITPYDFTNTPLSAANNFTTLYALSTGQVAEFGAIMWAKLSDDNFWHSVGVTFSNDFSINPADMMRYFNFLRYYPFDLKPYASTYASGIFIGRSTIPIQFPVGVEYPRRVNRNLIQIDGGTVTPKLSAPYDTNDFRVMDPSTQIQAHIPFCGTVQLSAAECYGKELHLKYVVDLQSGAIQATITVQSDTLYIVATLAGTCGASVQITSNNNIEFLTRIATVATGGVSSAATMATQGAKIAGAEGAAVGAVAGALTGTVSALAGLPPVTVHKQGNTTGFANYGGDPRAYVTIQTPKRSKPASYAKAVGYISNKQAKIADLSGYTEMINPDLSGITAHQDELEEIRQLLETGFFA